MDDKESPTYIQTSLAASLTLGLQQGSFHRNAKLRGLNLLLHYKEGCLGRCHFCGRTMSWFPSLMNRRPIRIDTDQRERRFLFKDYSTYRRPNRPIPLGFGGSAVT